MKRFISMLLALALCISVLGGMSIAGAEEVAEDGTCKYTLNLDQIDKTDPDEWDSTMTEGALQSTIVPIIGYGDHGFKYWTADSDTYNAVATDSKLTTLQLISGGIRLYGNNAKGTANLTTGDGVRVSIAFEKPSAVPSFYSVKVGRISTGANASTAAEIYASPLIEDNKDINHYMSTAARNGNTYSFSLSTVSFSELIYNNGLDDHVFSFYTGKSEELGYGLNVQLSSLTLTPETVTGINLSLSSPYCFMGGAAKASVTATLGSGSTKGVVDSYVKYESSNTDVATISADGTITPVANGTTTITATVGEYSASQTFKVGTKIYSFVKPVVSADYWDSTLNSENMQSTIVPLIGYGTHGYKYWDADEKTIENIGTNVRALQYPTYIRVWSHDERDDETFANPNGAKLALALETPTKGFYEITHTSGASDGKIGKLDIYMTEISAEDEAAETRAQVESFLTSENLVKTGSSSNTGTHSYNKIIAPSGNNNLIWAVSVDPESKFSMSMLQLEKLEVSAITLEADASAIELTETTTVNAKANDKKIAHSFVTYESLTPEIAKVAEDGTVTALAAGEATIKATAGGLADTVTITVAEPEPEEPGEEITDTTVKFGAFADEGGTVTDVNVVKNVTIGDSVTVEATANEGYEFAYWRNASGKHLSSKAKETFTVNTNTSVIAVFDKVETTDEDTTAPVYFYNENGSLIKKKDVEIGKTFGEAKADVATSLTGHVFSKWSIDDNAVINKLLRAVALYNKEETEYKVTVGGNVAASGTYGTEVTVTGSDSFKAWKLDDNIVSYDKEYKFLIWGDITLEEVTEGEAKSEPTVAINKSGDNYFIVYNVPTGYTLIEAGIVFAKSGEPTVGSFYSKATAKTTTGQFTSKSGDGTETVARGYVMFRDGDNKIRVIYAD